MYQLMITIGIVIAFLSNTFLATDVTIGGVTGGHWRIMLGVIAIPAAIVLIGVYFLPESPRWLFLKGFRERAIEVFERMKLDEAEIASEVRGDRRQFEGETERFRTLKSTETFAGQSPLESACRSFNSSPELTSSCIMRRAFSGWRGLRIPMNSCGARSSWA